MKYIFSVMIMAATATAGAQQVFRDADAQVRQVGHFTRVEVSSAIDLQLSQGKEDQVAVSGNKDNLDNILTEVRGGVLKISYSSKKWLHNGGKARVYVSAVTLEKISGTGASNVTVNGVLNCKDLSVDMSGASDFHGELTADNLDVEVSGASDMRIKGSTANLKLEASGASKFDAYDFMADNALIDASGASEVKLTTNKVINAEASGASSISYKGQGQEGKIRSSGASSISKRN